MSISKLWRKIYLTQIEKSSIWNIIGISMVSLGIFIGGSAYYMATMMDRSYDIAGWTFPVAIMFIAIGGYIIGVDL
jgi:hypothetical protein